jgi:hypothetical protein
VTVVFFKYAAIAIAQRLCPLARLFANAIGRIDSQTERGGFSNDVVAQLLVGHLLEPVHIAMLDLIEVESAQLAAQLFGPNCRSELAFFLAISRRTRSSSMCISMVSSDLNS